MANGFGTQTGGFNCPNCGVQLTFMVRPTYGFATQPGWGTGAGFGAQGYGAGWTPAGTWGTTGYGLGGLRRWGGQYSEQYTSTGLPTDEEMEEMIYDSIDDDPLIPWDADIEVKVETGQVTLTGSVPNKMIKHAAGQDAWWITGVTDVNNNITVTGRRRARGAREEQRQEAPAGR
ncbi:MAG: BON domain-containing protein [Ardenticatenaceae bacterium]|nr:BON domain-containing protein [Ardenticatenaceae bacterium]